MPQVVTSYPGVYIEEIPSGNHTITGVATSITAFVGRAPQGPIDLPMTVFNFGEYQRAYGGLAYAYPMSYAVQDFFSNGGSTAVICRLVAEAPTKPAAAWAVANAAAAAAARPVASDAAAKSAQAAADADKADASKAAAAKAAAATAATDHSNAAATAATSAAQQFPAPPAGVTDQDAQDAHDAATAVATAATGAAPAGDAAAAAATAASAIGAAPAARATSAFGGVSLVAANPGVWGNKVSWSADIANIGPLVASNYSQYGLVIDDLFNLTLTYKQPSGIVMTERFTNVSVKGDAAPNRLDRVLASQSVLAQVATDLSASTPTLPVLTKVPSPQPAEPFTGGADSGLLQVSDYTGNQSSKTGMYLLEHANLFNLLCIPPDTRDGDTDPQVLVPAADYCALRRAMLIIDPPVAWLGHAKKGELDQLDPTVFQILEPLSARAAAVYFPRIIKEDVLMRNQLSSFPACGAIAGVFAATDAQAGVWKAPAGLDAGLNGVAGLEVTLTDMENGQLNPIGINCLRTFPVVGSVIWGARTLRGADQLSDDYKYVPVRRLTDYIEESLYRGTKWAVFQPNAEPLWSSLRLAINSFMADLSRQGAFYGYKVVCDSTTTTQLDIDRGVVNVLVMFAPVKPAEFVVLQFQQTAGQIPA
jgi:uncharacterized protein